MNAMTLREMAEKNMAEMEADEAKNRELEQQSLRKEAWERFFKVFGIHPDSDVGAGIVTSGDLKFQYIDHRFYLLGPCPHCGEECQGGTIVHDLISLGYAIHNFYPMYHTDCQRPQKDATISKGLIDQLASILHQILDADSSS